VRRQTAPSGEDIGFVGQIEKVDVDVLLHIREGLHPGDSPRSAADRRALVQT